jgi:4-amino-4-deoxy-L-arabinose transferase-like glycosyltransferase
MIHARREAVILIAICAMAAGLRLIGLQYGLPAVYNPDEAAIMARTLSFARGTLNPGNFLYPTFYFYVLFAWVAAYLGWVWITGRVESITALQQLYFTAPTGIYTAGRALGVAAGTVTVLLTYRLARSLTNRPAALAAAIFLAVAPLHVRDSHYVKHDVPATLAIIAAYIAMTRLWPHPRPGGVHTRDTLLAAATCGVAFSTHYYCIFLAVPLTIVIVQSFRGHGWNRVRRELAIAAAASAVVFFALSPFIALEPATAWRDIVANRQIVVDRAIASGAFAPAFRYAEMLWRDSLGTPVLLLAFAGVVWMLTAAPGRAILLLAFAGPFLLFISNTAPASRYLVPLLPFLAVFAGWTVAGLAASSRRPSVAFWALTILAAALPLQQSVRTALFFKQVDTRTLAERYIESHVPSETTIVVQPYSAMLTPSHGNLVEALTRTVGGPEHASTKFRLQLSLNPYPSPSYRLVYLGSGLDADKIYVDYDELGGSRGLDPLRGLGVALVVVKRYNNPDPETLPFLATLAREGRRVAAFSPYRPDVTEAEQARVEPFLHNTDTRIDDALERPGPPLEIWQLNGPGS